MARIASTGDKPVIPRKEDFVLCSNCRWTADLQTRSYYKGHVHIASSKGSRAIWNLGDEYLLKEMPFSTFGSKKWVGYDVATTNYVREHTTVPVTEECTSWRGKESHFIFMKKVPGESLDVAMSKGKIQLSDLERLAREVVECLVELRKHTRPTPQSVTGEKVHDYFYRNQKEIGYLEKNKDEWWARVEPMLKFDGERAAKIKEFYVDHEAPYVLTHGDLSTNNIMVQDGRLTGIIDWEHSGFYPDWWEWVAVEKVGLSVWGSLIQREMQAQIGDFGTAAGAIKQFRWAYTGPPPPRRDSFSEGTEFCNCRPIRPGDVDTWYRKIKDAKGTRSGDP